MSQLTPHPHIRTSHIRTSHIRTSHIRDDLYLMEKPSTFGREVLGLELIGRHDEVLAVEPALLGRERLFLIGPRRFGKTSILATAAARARVQGASVIRVNA